MCEFRAIRVGYWGIMLLAACASAATVRFEIQALEKDVPITGDNPTITVAPGGQVSYEVLALVTSADPATPDNNGLGYFLFDILTDLNITQPPIIGVEEAISDSFSFLLKAGTPTDDDLLQVRAAQDTLTGSRPLIPGVAEGQTQVIVGGLLNTPTDEGTYQVTVGGSMAASVFAAGGTATLVEATPTAGTGFTIIVAAPVTDDNTTTDNTDSTDNTTETNDTTTTETTTATTVPQALALGAIALALGAFTFWAFLNLGAWAGAISLVIALATALAAALTNTTTTG